MDRPIFTKEMKETHTILLPTMLPIHFNLMSQILNQHGYHSVVLANDGRSVINEGLRNVHNDTCYPALLVIGQFIDALESGKYDLDKVALLITQTGGGCRASNYIHLLRKALKKSGYGQIPVISLSVGGLESNPGFKLTLPIIIQFLYAVLLGDLLMLLSNQSTPYEKNKGDTKAMVDRWEQRLLHEFASTKIVHYSHIMKFKRKNIAECPKIPQTGEKKVRVGIVGEIYVKYSPLGNNNLEEFLLSEGAEVVVPGLLDFCMYCVYNGLVDEDLYGGKFWKYQGSKVVYRYLLKKQKDVIAAIKKEGSFQAQTPFDETVTLCEPYINHGVKMGEGWLLTSEILELIGEGVENVVCTQPFGCLPNHIVAKGMIRSIKEKHPEANLVAVDYDPGASAVNQQNRIKLMLANARRG